MPCVILCAPLHTGSHPKSHFLFHTCSCKSWKHQFIITRQTLLEPVRLCLAVELDFPARNAGMDEHQVAQCILERMFCQWFPTYRVSRFPLFSLRGNQQQGWRGWHDCSAPRKGCSREEERSWKVVPQKVSRWNQAVSPTSQPHPEGSRLPFPSVHFWCAISPEPGRLQNPIHNSESAGQYSFTCLAHQSLPKTINGWDHGMDSSWLLLSSSQSK